MRELNLAFNLQLNDDETETEKNLDSYLANAYDFMLNSSIEESNRLVTMAGRKAQHAFMDAQWEQTKQEWLIAQSFSKVSMQSESGVGTSVSGALVALGGTGQIEGMNPTMEACAKTLETFHSARKHNSTLALASLFASVVGRGDADREDLWTALKWIVGENTATHSRIDSNYSFKNAPIYPKQYQADYDNNSVGLLRALVSSSIGYLESVFFSFVEDSLNARVSIFADFSATIKDYVQSLLLDASLVQSAIVYFSVRCGKWAEALSAAVPLQSTHPTLVQALQLVGSKQLLPENIWRSLHSAYGEWNTSHTAPNPYLECVYLLLGRFEVRPPPSLQSLLGTTEDFLWFMLSNVWLYEASLPTFISSPDAYKLSSLQSNILHRGADYFSLNGQAPLRYAIILLLTLQFEQMIAYLLDLSSSPFVLDAIHTLLALDYYGLIKCQDSSKSFLYDKNSGSLNVIGIITRYTEPFAFTHPSYALDYLLLLIDVDASKLETERMKAISLFLVKSKNYDLLIGSYKDGAFKAGLLFERLSSSKAMKIVKLAADLQNSKKDDVDAMKLSLLCQDYNQVGSLICQLLSDAFDGVPVDIDTQIKLAIEYLLLLAQIKPVGIDSNIAFCLDQMYLLANLFRNYSDKQLDAAFSTLNEMQICPLHVNHIEAAVTKVLNMDQLLAHHVPRVAQTALNLLFEKYKQAKQSVPANRLQDMQIFLNDLRDQASVVTEFLSRISAHMTVQARLMEQVLATRAQFN